MLSWSTSHPEFAGEDLADVAATWGVTQAQALEELKPGGAIYYLMDEADVERILAYPHTMIGSDGLPHDQFPHPRLWGTFPRVLGRFSRDRGLLTLEDAVHRMTGLPAQQFGLHGRGSVKPGAHADLVLFDPKSIADRATFSEPTLQAQGINMVTVNGIVVLSDGKPTGARPGRVLQRGLAAENTAAH
jgi:N-acyl-D-amino-acid deacylase